MPRLTLSLNALHLTLRPDWGGRVERLTFDGRDVLHPMPTTRYEPEDWPRGGAYPLIPFHNRIRGGRFAFDGREYALDTHPTEPNALHGPASRPAWQTEQRADHAARLWLDWQPDRRWPFAFHAEQRFELTASGLLLSLSVTNTGTGAMPAGLGWHPYFTKCTGIAVAAQRDWHLDDGYFPTGTWQVPATPLRTHYLSDWSDLRLRLENGLDVLLLADPLFFHLVIHDPAPAYSCVEPVSHLAGALNLSPQRVSDRMRRLDPGETLAGMLALVISPT